MVTRQDLIDNGYDDVVLIDDDSTLSALIGITHDRRAVYDYDLLVEAFMTRQNWDYDTAIDWIGANVTCVTSSDNDYPLYLIVNFLNQTKQKDPREIVW